MTFLAIMFGIPCGVALTAALNYGFKRALWPDLDDTDKGLGERSGLLIVKDHGTGREYLVTVFGGITPRLPKE